MKNVRLFVGILIVAVVSGFVAVGTYVFLVGPQERTVEVEKRGDLMRYARMTPRGGVVTDFTQAAETSVDAVVHVKVKTVQREEYSSHPLFDFFYGYREPRERSVEGAGSGVLISSDGYIVTNNHVIDNSDEIEIVLNDKRSYAATLVGTDKMTDIALLKIQEADLPCLTFGNSDELKVGEWVLAVGNPFNLTSTVTAGVVSAKARSINIINNQNNTLGIESFIQTDAAVNPGNSGGALVNTEGLLVGINTAIASPTGSYSGYSFAVPVSIVKKVVADLQEYGEVQRAFLGVTIMDIDAALADKENLETLKGVYVAGFAERSGALEAGLKEGDVIVGLEGSAVESVAELQEHVGRYRPGDQVEVEVLRGGKKKKYDVELKNIRGNTDIVQGANISSFGASFEEMDAKDLRALGLSHGVRVVDVRAGKFKDHGIKEGFVITKMSGVRIKTIADIESFMKENTEGIFITGVYPNGRVAYYAIAPTE